uniref:AAA-ATPase-like domain-containing protein n=1 Tax=Chlorobium chlorochromatii (strain CaD3) TaxID=340177 RepID=Q3ASN0_CHLCH
MQQIPFGIQTFKKIRQNNLVYIDKTADIANLVAQHNAVFLSRPRRFGKSLLIDTIQDLFEGNKTLFEGLYIADKWNWTTTYPVIKIDFAAGVLHSVDDLKSRIRKILFDNKQRLQITCEFLDDRDLAGCFADLISKAHEKYQQPVVVLVDEYDKPILDNIENVDIAIQMREGLKNIYSVLKAQDAHLRFVMLTGVSKFSKVSLFSGLNNLDDITLDATYATICGYRQVDLETSFAEHLEEVDWERLKLWYNGYNFLGESVYNPFDILNFIKKQHTYRSYWFETGTPTFLMKLFAKERYFLPNLENVEVGDEILDSFDVEDIQLETLLFQTGYLTIKQRVEMFGNLRYQLKIPNQEVRVALNNHFINVYTAQASVQKYAQQKRFYTYLMAVDMLGLQQALQALFAGIPWNNFTNNDLPQFEGYYASVLYAFFCSLNAMVIAEDTTNQGQVDLTIIFDTLIYIIEIKRDTSETYQVSPENVALQQLLQKRYFEKYQGQGKEIVQVGMIFNTVQRNLVQLDWAKP